MKCDLKRESDAGKLKSEMSFLANSYTNNYKPNKNTLDKHCIIKRIRNNNNIVIMRPDKCAGVVILNKTDYNKIIYEVINDNTKFKLLNKDPTITREEKLQKCLLNLKKKGMFNEDEYKSIYPVGSRTARIYGLPKVHKLKNKTDTLRPIIIHSK